MSRIIDYYLIGSSPYAYLGHKALHEIAARHGATIRYKPIDIMGVWANSGSVPLGQRTPLRQRYRRIELQRFREMRGLMLNLEPKFFPVDSALADRVAIALVDAGADPSGYLWRVHEGVWAKDENIADRGQLGAYLAAEGHDAQAILAAADTAQAEDRRQANTQAAASSDAVGAPVYVLDGEPFWGQDRLDLLDAMLTTGRAAYRP
ncbi:MAG: 2-hydroxychromene-2-carboxylate isomerase [Aliihoeflea sp.]